MPITEKYVTPSGAGTNDGLSEANAFSWAQFVTDFNLQSAGGVRYNIKQGTYSGLSTAVLTGDGTATNPLIIRGYKTTIGDATVGRLSTGLLDTSNMPHLQFASTAFINGAGATFTILESVRVSASNANRSVSLGASSVFFNCKIDMTAGNSGVAIEGSEPTSVLQCDLSNASTTGAPICGVVGPIIGNFITGATTAGAGISYGGGVYPIIGNVIVGCGIGIDKTLASGRVYVCNNTISGCGGDGIRIVTTTTNVFSIIGNHVTGCGGFGINLNTPAAPFVLSHNRLRNNTSGNVNGGGDWATAQTWLHVTTAGSNAADFTNSGSSDYSLKTTAPGFGKNVAALANIGANGSPASSAGSRLVGPSTLVSA